MTALAEAPERMGRGFVPPAGTARDECQSRQPGQSPSGQSRQSPCGQSPSGECEVTEQLAILRRATAPGGLFGASGDEALRVIEAAEAVKAWAESGAVAAAAHLTRALESDRSMQDPSDRTRMGNQRFWRECRSVAAREIQVATGRPITACQSLIWFAACEDERTATVRSLMGQGRLSYYRALSLVEKTQRLDAVAADRIAAKVLAPLTSPSGEVLPGQAPLSQATFNRRLHRQLVLHHGLVGEAERTHAEAVRRRDCRVESHPVGTGQLLVWGDGPRVAAAGHRVDRIARKLRKDGDARTIAQLRSDVALDLLMRGWVPDDPTFQSLGKAPDAVIRVLVPLSTLFDRDAARLILTPALASGPAADGTLSGSADDATFWGSAADGASSGSASGAGFDSVSGGSSLGRSTFLVDRSRRWRDHGLWQHHRGAVPGSGVATRFDLGTHRHGSADRSGYREDGWQLSRPEGHARPGLHPRRHLPGTRV